MHHKKYILNMMKIFLVIVAITGISFAGSNYLFAADEVNYITNPGFETDFTSWSTSAGCSVTESVSHTGSKCIQIDTDSMGSMRWAATEATCYANHTYKISAYFKANGLDADGAYISLDWRDKNGALLGYQNGHCITGTFDWKLYTIEVTVPRNAERVKLNIIAKSRTGSIWCDDVVANLKDTLSLRSINHNPSINGIIYNDQKKELQLCVEAQGNSVYPLSLLALDVTIIDANNKSVMHSYDASLRDKLYNTFRFDINGIQPGQYRAMIELRDKSSGLKLQSNEIAFTVASQSVPLRNVYIDDYDRCIVNGVPTFILGLYSSGTTNDELSMIANSSFNCLLDYAILAKQASELQAFLDLANTHGKKVIFSLKDCYDSLFGQWTLTHYGNWTGSLNVVKGLVETYKKHPAVLAWYLNDEKVIDYLPQILERNAWIHENDKDHPTFQVLQPNYNVCSYVGSTDVIGLDDYPVWSKYKSGSATACLDHFGNETRRLRGDVMGSQAMWMVMECSSFRGETPNSKPPTYDEMMCMAVQAIIEGARGLVFYNFRELRTYDGDSQWIATQNVAQSLKALSPIALGIDAVPAKQASVSDQRIRSLTRLVDNDIWILAVNPSYNQVNAIFTIPTVVGNVNQVEVGLPQSISKTIQVNNGVFADSIEPLGIRAYHLILP